jgi:hypothetical protein
MITFLLSKNDTKISLPSKSVSINKALKEMSLEDSSRLKGLKVELLIIPPISTSIPEHPFYTLNPKRYMKYIRIPTVDLLQARVINKINYSTINVLPGNNLVVN